MKRFLLTGALCCLLPAGLGLTGCGQPVLGQASYENVDSLNQEAEADYNNGLYADALTKYAEALAANPINMDTQLGIAACQIALGNYSLAAVNLSAAADVDPSCEEIYDLYVELGEASGNLNYAQTAISLAQTHQNDAFLSRVPSPPQLSSPAGEYSEKLELTITAEEGSEIHISEYDGSSRTEYIYDGPLVLTTGTTEIEAYCMRDGIPSEVVSSAYTCFYDPSPVAFADPVVEQAVRDRLGIPEGPITDLDCEELDYLDLYSYEYDESARSLEDLRLLPNLTSLYITGQRGVADFSPVTQCRKLHSLTLSDCGISDLSFVTAINGLSDLSIEENQVADLSPIAGMPELTYLYINDNPITDISVIKDMDLTYLSVNTWQIPDASFLQNFENLSSLYLYDCAGYDISSIGGLSQLTRLNLYNLTDFFQLSALKGLQNLEYLYLRGDSNAEAPAEVIQDLQRSLPNCEIRY